MVIDNEIFPILIVLCESSQHNIKKEAIWALANATSGGTKAQMDFLFKLGLVKTLNNVLASVSEGDVEIMAISLEALINISETCKRSQDVSNITLEKIFGEIKTGKTFVNKTLF